MPMAKRAKGWFCTERCCLFSPLLEFRGNWLCRGQKLQNAPAVSYLEQTSMLAPKNRPLSSPPGAVTYGAKRRQAPGRRHVLPQALSRDRGFNSTCQPEAVCPKKTPQPWANTRRNPCQAALWFTCNVWNRLWHPLRKHALRCMLKVRNHSTGTSMALTWRNSFLFIWK